MLTLPGHAHLHTGNAYHNIDQPGLLMKNVAVKPTTAIVTRAKASNYFSYTDENDDQSTYTSIFDYVIHATQLSLIPFSFSVWIFYI